MFSIALLVFLIIFAIFIMFIYSKYYAKKSHTNNKKHSTHDKTLYGQQDTSRPNAIDEQTQEVHIGLNEMDQNTASRGRIPFANQPDHTANMWKTHRSHDDEPNCIHQEDNSVNAEVFTPVRGKVVNMKTDSASNMHLTSRFATSKS